MHTSTDLIRRFRWPGSPYHLAALRIAIGAQTLYAVNSKIFDLLLAVGKRQKVTTIFPAWFDDFTAAHLVPGLVVFCTVGAILLTIGLFTRVVLPLLTTAFIVLYGFYYLGANAPAQWLYLWFPLLVLCFARSQDVWSLDAMLVRRRGGRTEQDPVNYRWPIELCVLWFCYIYFAAGLAKVLPMSKGFAWFNGQTSKEIIYYRYLDSPFHYLFGEPFLNYAEASVIFGVITVAALLLELATIVLVLTNKYHLWILGLLVAMHLFLYMTGVGGFTQTALMLGIALMPMTWFDRKMRQPVLGER